MKDYYQVLGVNYTADAQMIKRAYRKLAVLYHPDKNPDPAAEALFKEINEAYDVLSDPQKKILYDLRLQSPFTEPVQQKKPYHRDPAYRRRRTSTPPRKSQREQMFDMMMHYRPHTQTLLKICFFASLFLWIDFLLPSRTSAEIITDAYFELYEERRTSESWGTIITSTGRTINLPLKIYKHFEVDQEITVKSTLFLNTIIKIESKTFTYRVANSIYGNFIFAPFLLFIISSLGLYFRNKIEYAFNFSIVSTIMLILTLILYLISINNG